MDIRFIRFGTLRIINLGAGRSSRVKINSVYDESRASEYRQAIWQSL